MFTCAPQHCLGAETGVADPWMPPRLVTAGMRAHDLFTGALCNCTALEVPVLTDVVYQWRLGVRAFVYSSWSPLESTPELQGPVRR
jgi:hypothetical protein